MKYRKSLAAIILADFILCAVLWFASPPAFAQCNGVFQNGTVCGNLSGAPSLPYQVVGTALPGLNLVPGTTTVTGPGAQNGPLLDVGGILQNPSNLTNTYIAPGPANTMKGTLNGTTTSDITLVACNLAYQITQWITGTGWQCGVLPVLPSRAVAKTLNLSAYNAVVTLGYANPGDGGGATFQRITGNFLDSFVTADTTTIGSGCPAGTYLSVYMTGGHGTGLYGQVVITGGGVMSSFTLQGYGGNGYQSGDVLTIPTSASVGPAFTCSGTQPSITVTGLSTPLGSFTDTASGKFQIVTDQGNYNNVRQFGAKCDWNVATGDGAATNDTVSFQNALDFAGAQTSYALGGALGTSGTKLLVPRGSCLVGPIQIPWGVEMDGMGRFSTQLKLPDATAATANWITICDPTTLLSCFGSRLEKMFLYAGNAPANSGVSVIFSNNIQQQDVLRQLTIFSEQRACIFWSVGYGGAASVGVEEVECAVNSQSANTAAVLAEYVSAVMTFHKFVMSSSVTFPGQGILIANANQNAIVDIDDVDFEGINQPVQYNVASGSGFSMLSVDHAHGGGAAGTCGAFVSAPTGTQAGGIRIGQVTGVCTNSYVIRGTASGLATNNTTVFF